MVFPNGSVDKESAYNAGDAVKLFIYFGY